MRTITIRRFTADEVRLTQFECPYDLEGQYLVELATMSYPVRGNAYGFYTIGKDGYFHPVLITPSLEHAVRVAKSLGIPYIIRIGMVESVAKGIGEFAVKTLFCEPDEYTSVLLIDTTDGVRTVWYTPEVVDTQTAERLLTKSYDD